MSFASRRDDGALVVHRRPVFRRNLTWHKPTGNVPELQWAPDTGLTRYEWAREQTPDHQRPLFRSMQRDYQESPPRPLPAELLEQLEVVTLPTGLRGFPPDLAVETLAYEIYRKTPDGWTLRVTAHETPEGDLVDKLHASHDDCRTLPDWALLVRLRSWVLPDDRAAFIWLPAQTANCLTSYENARPNNLQMVSPR